MCVCVCRLYIAWVHLWMCAKARVCVSVRVEERRGSPLQSVDLVEWVGEGQGDLEPGGNRLGQPLSPHPLLCLISDSVWGRGVY